MTRSRQALYLVPDAMFLGVIMLLSAGGGLAARWAVGAWLGLGDPAGWMTGLGVFGLLTFATLSDAYDSLVQMHPHWLTPFRLVLLAALGATGWVLLLLAALRLATAS